MTLFKTLIAVRVLYNTRFMMSSTLESYINHTVSVITADGRQIVGTLKGFDQTVNIILDDSHERVYSMTCGVEQVALGLYIVRGDNIAVIGEIDEELDNKLDFTIIKAEPLNPTDDLVEMYRQYAITPIPISANTYSEHQNRERTVRVLWKIRDMDKLEFSSFTKNYCVKFSKNGDDIKTVSNIGDPIDVSNDLAVASTANGSKYMATLRKGNKDNETGKYKQWLEIWDKNTKLKSIDIDSLEQHGSIITDPQFGSFSWSPNGLNLLYVAEYKYPKAQSYFKKKKASDNTLIDGDTRGQEFLFLEDWGESFDGIHHTIVCILNVSDYTIKTIELSGKTLGQPFWIENGECVAFIAWNETPRRLGIVYCINRLSSIYSYHLNSASDALPHLIYGTDNSCVRSPRSNKDGSGFVYLESESGGPHRQANRLMYFDCKTKSNSIIIEKNAKREMIVNGDQTNYGKIAALFVDDLPKNCFTNEGNCIVFDLYNEIQKLVCYVNLNTNELNIIKFPLESVTVSDVKDDIILAIGSSPNYKPNVFIAKFNKSNIENIKWTKLENDLNESLPEVTFDTYAIASQDSNKLLHSILVSPKSVSNTIAPTIIVPHGGPHANSIAAYSTVITLFAKLGLKTLMVNYRGSLGVDEDYVNSLCGNVGSMDVTDMITCIKYLAEKQLIDSSKLILYGGSHGGFLVTHLSGQYSEMGFKSCIALNPVTDLAGMLEVTDIPDWNYTEGLGLQLPYSFTSTEDPIILSTMFEKSPMKWIDNVKVPTLMLLGKRDRRVPMSQGLKYYRSLRARGVPTKCYVYDDKHDLAKVDVNGDIFVNICIWIFNHLHS